MNYAQAVARGRKLLTRSEADQWELAELTYDRTTGDDRVTQVKWAGDLGVTDTHVRNLAKTWLRFGGPKRTSDRSNLTFNECYLLASVSGERGRDLVAHANTQGRSVATIHRNGHRRDPLEDAREYMSDRRRARKLLRDPKIRAIVERELKEPDHDREAVRPSRRVPEFKDVAELDAVRFRLYELLGGMLDRKLSAGERRTVAGSADAIGVAAEWMGSYARTGDRSFEDALEALLADLVATAPSRRRTPPVVAAPVPAPAPEPAEATPAEPRTRPQRRTPREPKEPTGRGSRGRRAS